VERSNSNYKFGKIGEAKAVDFLVKSGYSILARNYRWRSYEVDIIAEDKEVVLAVEVKSTRHSKHLKNPFSRRQLKRVCKALIQFSKEPPVEKELRVDGLIYYESKEQFIHLKEIYIPGI